VIITITNLATGKSRTVTSGDGGFDPVALEAEPGDELKIVIQFADRSTIEYTSLVPERRRPRVVRTIPPNGATEVVLSVAVAVVFSEPIDLNSVTTEDIQLRIDGEPVEGTLEWSEDGLRSWFRTAEPLQEATTYSLVITTGVLDLQGDPLEEEVGATFTTGSGIFLVSAGGYHTCALRADGVAICWGDNTLGQCGRPFSEIEPPRPVPTTLRFTSIISGHLHTCGITVDGEGYCWGWNYHGQLGNGTTTDSDSPVRVSGGHSFVSLAAGTAHTCALTTDGVAYCWGRHDYLQLGPGEGERCIHDGSDLPCSTTPLQAGNGFKSLTAGHLFTCGLRTDGAAYCWGGDHTGQLGTDDDWQIETCAGWRCSRHPRPVSGGHTLVNLSSGLQHTCGIRTDGATYCWGKNLNGQLGAGFVSDHSLDRLATPLRVIGGHTFVSIAGGSVHTCALTGDGQAFCWGSNVYGELGVGGPLSWGVPEPLKVTGSHHFVGLATSKAEHMCAMTPEGDVYCWGWNQYGQLGHDPSSLEISMSPLLVPLG
jgi:alpha-tubulin suppressor-like RCC1 family protein